jgi:hypothetical protein
VALLILKTMLYVKTITFLNDCIQILRIPIRNDSLIILKITS